MLPNDKYLPNKYVLCTYYKAGAVAGTGGRAEKSEAKLLLSGRLCSSTASYKEGYEGTGCVVEKISKLLFALFNLILVRCIFRMFPGMCNITMSRVGIYLINNKNNQLTLEVYAPNIFLIIF